MSTTSIDRPCGCGSAQDPLFSPRQEPSCGCGCGGCAGCAASTSGTSEATRRPGVAAPTCLPPRPRFFPGQLVTDGDLRAVVDYHRRQQQLGAAVIGGWGVYAGYALTLDAGACAVCIGPGVAVDARGRSLVHGGSTRVGHPDRRRFEHCLTPPDETLILAVVYDDHLDAPRPRYGSGCGASADPGCDHARVDERIRFVWLDRLPEGYWTSGCLLPCEAAPPPAGAPCGEERPAQGEPALDVCTPPTGVRGGAGVFDYARRIAARWNLLRNAAIFGKGAGAGASAGADASAGAGVGACAILDVISGMSWVPSAGEAIVALAEVKFMRAGGKPGVELRPLRRRVLSNADLTYLVAWMLERTLSGEAPAITPEREPSPPPSSTLCPPDAVPAAEVEALKKRIAELEAKLAAKPEAVSRRRSAEP